MTSDSPVPSRFFTVLGWVCILLGLYVLVTTTVNHLQSLRLPRGPELQRHRILTHVYHATVCLLSAFSMGGGFGLWKRRPWALMLMSAAGGAWAAHGSWWLVWAAPRLLAAIQDLRDTAPLAALNLGFSILTEALYLLFGLIVLGGLYHEADRREFPLSHSPFTRHIFFASAGSGMVPVGVIYSCLIYSGSP
jgi:hypothetical protein